MSPIGKFFTYRMELSFSLMCFNVINLVIILLSYWCALHLHDNTPILYMDFFMAGFIYCNIVVNASNLYRKNIFELDEKERSMLSSQNEHYFGDINGEKTERFTEH